MSLLASVVSNEAGAWFTPFLPLLGVIAGGIVVGAFAVYNRARGAVETRAPDVNEIWRRQEAQDRALDVERRLRRRLEDLVRDLRRAFQGYVRRVQGGGSTELSHHEQKMFDASVPTIETIAKPQE